MKWKTIYTSGNYTITKAAPKQFFAEQDETQLGEFKSVGEARKFCQTHAKGQLELPEVAAE